MKGGCWLYCMSILFLLRFSQKPENGTWKIIAQKHYKLIHFAVYRFSESYLFPTFHISACYNKEIRFLALFIGSFTNNMNSVYLFLELNEFLICYIGLKVQFFLNIYWRILKILRKCIFADTRNKIFVNFFFFISLHLLTFFNARLCVQRV